MTGVGDFPGNCSTNTYILNDFNEVAYIVCTLAIPPPSSHAAQAPSREGNLARLKHTEIQFRHATIFAAVDPDSLQLFTFYKKTDIIKDHKTLLDKFNHILKSNSCTISYKAAVKVPDLIKPEHARLHRLFVSAIVASTKMLSNDRRRIMRLGQRYHVIQASDEEIPEAASDAWSLIRTDLQIIPSGHVTLTVAVNQSLSLLSLANLPKQDGLKSQAGRLTGVVLAPGGHIAFHHAESDGTSGMGAPSSSSAITGERRSVWQDTVSAWLNTIAHAPIDKDASWVELMLPVYEQKAGPVADDGSPKEIAEANHKLLLKAILWPSQMCFMRGPEVSSTGPEMIADQDPLQFVEEWIQTAAEREHESQQHDDPRGIDDDDIALVNDEGQFDYQESYQPFGPPVFPTSQTVYPTPPDVIMTQTTPGMSSVDGLAMTPATLSRPPAEVQQAQQDTDMAGVEAAPADGVGSGLYDEDLFEEIPDDAFDEQGAGGEPNWDFFDKPDMDVDSPEDSRPTSKVKGRDATPPKVLGSFTAPIDPVVPTTEGGPNSSLKDSAAFGEPQASGVTQEHEVSVGPVVDQLQRSGSLVEKTPLPRGEPDASIKRRRSSAYDRVATQPFERSHDAKYSTKGEFWFDVNSNLSEEMNATNLTALTQRHLPSPSDSSSFSDSSDDNQGWTSISPTAPAITPLLPWHEYRPESPASEKVKVDIDIPALQAEIRATLDLLKARPGGPSLEELFSRKRTFAGKAGLSAELRLMLAQIFVDQYSQASLLRHDDEPGEEQTSLRSEMRVSVDLSQMNCANGYASLSQLTDLTPQGAGRQSVGKLVRLSDPNIIMKRLDRQMKALPTITPFWDVLTLQPLSRPKSIIAFCLHPLGAGFAERCGHFLHRIGDAYGGCNLGVHSPGQLPGVTMNGIIAMTPEPMATARKFAEALANCNDPAGTAVVYIFTKAKDARSYIGSCRYFLGMFSYYRTFAASRAKPLELVLQVVPASFMLSNESLVIPPQQTYNELAFEVYGRIPPDSDVVAGACEYPIALAVRTDIVKFGLETRAISPISMDGAMLHVAYSFTDEKRWAITTWTDAFGHKALTMTFQMKVRNEAKGRPLEDVIKEIWEVSHDLMKKQRSRWRLIVARCGFYEATEINSWMHLANSETKSPTSCGLYLLSIEIEPTLKLFNTRSHTKSGQSNMSQQVMYGTPASTPQAMSTTSPENFVPATPTSGGTSAVNAPTPPEHGFDSNIDGDLNLEDPSEESWAVVLPYGVNQSHNMLEIRPALISGYLVKRLGIRDEDGTTMIGVHLIHGPSQATNPASGQREELIREILDQYRGLVTLAVARGCIDKMRKVLPWHIHTSVAASGVLGGLI